MPGRMAALVLWTVASVLAESTRRDDSTPARVTTRDGAAWSHGSSISRSTLRDISARARKQRLRRVTNRKNRRRGAQVTGLNSRSGRPGVQRRGLPGPRPSSPSCGVDRPYRKPGLNPKEYTSQGGEDAFLNRYFNGTRVGTYLDIGCNDGIDGSNTYYFQQRGWQGGSVCGIGPPCWCHSFGSRLPYALQSSTSAAQAQVSGPAPPFAPCRRVRRG